MCNMIHTVADRAHPLSRICNNTSIISSWDGCLQFHTFTAWHFTYWSAIFNENWILNLLWGLNETHSLTVLGKGTEAIKDSSRGYLGQISHRHISHGSPLQETPWGAPGTTATPLTSSNQNQYLFSNSLWQTIWLHMQMGFIWTTLVHLRWKIKVKNTQRVLYALTLLSLDKLHLKFLCTWVTTVARNNTPQW